jgi:hypothetical protein
MGNEKAILVPTALQAFTVSEKFHESPHEYRIAPLIQPNYVALKGDGMLQHDILDQLNLSQTRLEKSCGTRFIDVTSGEVRRERVGVYLSWCLPRVYRSGLTATESGKPGLAASLNKAGYTPAPGQDTDKMVVCTRTFY